jgi:uncharacterized membrane protein SpoIIM required for sporulation
MPDTQALLRQEVTAALERFGIRRRRLDEGRRRGGPRVLREAFELTREYECVAAHGYRVRSSYPAEHPFRRRIEDSLSDITFELAGVQRSSESAGIARARWVDRYRQAWRINFSLFVVVLLVFVASGILGYAAVAADPANAAALLPQSMLEDVLEKRRWFDVLNGNTVMGGVEIALNNIQVCLFLFALGAIFGVGGIAILAYNGAMVGAVLAFCRLHRFEEQLVGFIVSHGPLELTIIAASAFGSLILGRAFYVRPTALFPTRWSLASQQAGTVLAGVVPWLVLAAIVEAAVSPRVEIPVATKLTLGAGLALVFLLWSLLPPRQTT